MYRRTRTAKDDKLFITEILNDLHRNGFIKQGKADTLLRDWAAELREDCRGQLQSSKLKQTFINEVGEENW